MGSGPTLTEEKTLLTCSDVPKFDFRFWFLWKLQQREKRMVDFFAKNVLSQQWIITSLHRASFIKSLIFFS